MAMTTATTDDITLALEIPSRTDVFSAIKAYEPGAIFYGVAAVVMAWINAILIFGLPAFMAVVFVAVGIAFALLMWLTMGGTLPSERL
jgi:hypothetical protein